MAYCGLYAIFITPKTESFDSATEESEFPPKKSMTKTKTTQSNTCTTPNYSLVSSLWQTPERGDALISKCLYLWLVGRHPLG